MSDWSGEAKDELGDETIEVHKPCQDCGADVVFYPWAEFPDAKPLGGFRCQPCLIKRGDDYLKRVGSVDVEKAVAAERERIAAWFGDEDTVNSGYKFKTNRSEFDKLMVRDASDWDTDDSMQNIAEAIRSGKI